MLLHGEFGNIRHLDSFFEWSHSLCLWSPSKEIEWCRKIFKSLKERGLSVPFIVAQKEPNNSWNNNTNKRLKLFSFKKYLNGYENLQCLHFSRKIILRFCAYLIDSPFPFWMVIVGNLVSLQSGNMWKGGSAPASHKGLGWPTLPQAELRDGKSRTTHPVKSTYWQVMGWFRFGGWFLYFLQLCPASFKICTSGRE